MTRFVQLCVDQLGTGCELALRSAAVLALVSVVTLLLRRSSAAVRHLIWSTALIGVLLIPAVAAIAPVRLSIPVIGLTSGSSPAVVESSNVTAGSVLRPGVQLLASAANEVDADRSFDSLAAAAPDPHPQPTASALPPAESTGVEINWPALIVSAWLAGFIALTLPLLLGGWSLQRLRRSSLPLTAQMADELQALSRVWIGGRSVVGLLSIQRTMPMTWGVLRPVILLPIDAVRWPAERLRLVLMHELAHIRRRDCLFQMIGQVVRALHWFNPLAWWSLSQLRLEQEQACDDAVLNAGTHADEYAAELLSVSARLPQFSWDAAVALAMSRVTRLEQRLKAILNMHNNRRPLSKRSVALSLTLLGSLVFAVAIIQRHEVQGAPPPVGVAAISDEAAAQVKAAAQKAAADKPAASKDAPAAANPAASGPGLKLNAAAKTIESHSVVAVNESVLSEAAIRGMLETLKDPYSQFLTEDELKGLYQQLEGQLVGIGAALKKGGKDDPIVVELLLPNSPARLGGLKVGDVILAVNGQPAEKLEDTVKAIRGTAGTEVSIKILSADKKESVLTLKRGQIRLSAVKGLSISEQGQWQHWLDADGKVGYVQLAEFNATAATDLKATLKTLSDQGLKGLVLDMRGSPGGRLEISIEVAELFLKDSLIVDIRGRSNEQNSSHRARGVGAFAELPLVVVVDRHTASASEVLTAALQDNGRAVVVGERTFGKGSVQSIISLDGTSGPAIKLTTAQMLTPKGRPLSRQADSKEWGVDPQDGFYVPLTTEQRAARQQQRINLEKGILQPKSPLTPELVEQQLSDPALAAALKTLQSKLSTGEFAKTGQPLKDQELQFAKQVEVRKQRDELRKQVELLDRELGEVR